MDPAERLSVTVLGCDGSAPGPGGACSGYLLSAGATRVCLDAGPGTLANLQRHTSLAALDAVVVTHEHVDHWSDLEHLAVAAKWVFPRGPIDVYAPADLSRSMRTSAGAGQLRWHRVGDGTELGVGAMRITFSRTDHPVPTLAVRVDCGGRSLGYSADSGPAWELSELGPGLDLALCEATYLSDKEEAGLAHLSARQAGATARRSGARRLVITHIWPGIDRARSCEEASRAFGGPVDAARTDARYVV